MKKLVLSLIIPCILTSAVFAQNTTDSDYEEYLKFKKLREQSAEATQENNAENADSEINTSSRDIKPKTAKKKLSSIKKTKDKEAKFGLKGGVNIASMPNDLASFDSTTGFAIGAMVNIPLNEYFSIQPELHYTSKGANNVNPFGGKFVLDYLEMPLLFQVTPISFIDIFAGPYFAFLVDSKYIEGGVKYNLLGISGTDYGIKVGGRVKFVKLPNSGRLFIEGAYSKGLANINDDPSIPSVELKNEAIEIRVGVEY